MDKSSWIFGPVVVVFAIEFLLSNYLLSYRPSVDLMMIHIQLAMNKGIVGGFFSDWLSSVHQIPLLMAGVLLATLLYFVHFLAPIKSAGFRLGITLFFAGLLSNLLMRAFYGFVVDYVSLRFFFFSTPAFNVSDLFQLIGVAMIFTLQFRGDSYDENYDKKLWLSPQFQKRYIRELLKLGLIFVLAFGVLGYTFLKIMSDEYSLVGFYKDNLLKDFVFFYASSSICFLILLFFVGRYLSVFVVRPMLSFESYLRDLSEGDYQVFFVEEDDFKHLEELSDRVRDHLIELEASATQKMKKARK